MTNKLFMGIALFSVAGSAMATGYQNNCLPCKNLTATSAIKGIEIVDNGNKSFTVKLAANASFKAGSQTYDVNRVIGFYVVDTNKNMTASASSVSGWNFGQASSTSIRLAGWTSNTFSGGIKEGQTKTFTFSSLNGDFEKYGLRVAVDRGGNCGETEMCISAPVQTVPEPASMAALGLGLAGFIARKRRKN